MDELMGFLHEVGMRAEAVTIVYTGELYTNIETVGQTVGYLS
jgi:hypothetical protein